MKRKLLSLLMALTMALSLVPLSALAASYGDTAGHWAQAAIERWSGYGIVTGDGSGFRPNDNMTRAEAATVFSRLFSLTDATAKSTFTDVKAGDWYYDAVNKCVNAGIMNGVGDGMMKPNSPLTREMFFVMFARGLGIKEQSATKGLKADGAAWSAGYINALTDKGYVKGMDGKVNATANINRASVMALLDQTITTYANEAGATVTGTGKGVTLIAAEGVTVTGNVDTLVVAGSSEAETVAFAGDEDTAYASAVYAAPRFSVIIRNAVIALLNIIAPAKVELEGTTSVSSVAVTQTAAETTVDVGASASVAAVETAAAETKVEGAGKVEAVAATGEAADTVAVTTPNTEVATSKSVENADGSTTTTVTESKNDAAGKSTGETKTETTVKETTAADGTKTTEKTATATVTNAAGKVTETTKTESTVTEKTASDGTKTTETAATVTKADGTGKVVETTKTESTVKETTAADGTKTTETAATVAKTDAAGKTETTKTDATVTEKTAANGTKTTETAATVAKTDASGKTETTTTTATSTETTNANGSVTTATTATVEKTAADGTKTTDKVESTATATTNADGSTTTVKTETVATTGADGKTTTTKTESTATATVNANGTTTTATEAKVEKTDASGKTTTETVKSTETAKENADGSTTATTTTSTTDASGRTTTTTETKTTTEAESSVSSNTGAASTSAGTGTTPSQPAAQTQTGGGGGSGGSGGSGTTYYTVTFNANAPENMTATGTVSSMTVAAGSTITLPGRNAYTIEDNEFLTVDVWCADKNGDSDDYGNPGESYVVNGNVTLYALYYLEVESGEELTLEAAPKFNTVVRNGGKLYFASQTVAASAMKNNKFSLLEAGGELRIGTKTSSYAIVGTDTTTDPGDHFIALGNNSALYFPGDSSVVIDGTATIPNGKTWTNYWGLDGEDNPVCPYQIIVSYGSTLNVEGALSLKQSSTEHPDLIVEQKDGSDQRGGTLVFASAEKAVHTFTCETAAAWIGSGAVVAVKYGGTPQAIIGYEGYENEKEHFVLSGNYIELENGGLYIYDGTVEIGGNATVPEDKTWTNYWGESSSEPVAPYSIMIGHGSTLTVDGTLKLADVNKSEENERRSLLVLGIQDNGETGPATLTINGTLDATGSMLEIADGATVTFGAKAVAPAARAIVAKKAFAEEYNEETGVVGWATLIKASYYLQIGQGKKLNDQGIWVNDTNITTGKLTEAETTELTNYYETITKLDMSNKDIAQNGFYSGTDAGALTIFTGLTELNLSNTGVTDIGGIANLTSLTKLNISGLTSVTNGGALVKLTALTELDISNTGITDLNVMWKGENEGGVTAAAAPRFASLTKLTAKNLAMTSIAGLVEVVNSVQDNGYEDSGKTWDLSESTLTADDAVGHVCRIMNIFDAGTFNPPAMIAAANMNTNAAELATLATKAKETTITVPAGKKLTVGGAVYIGGSNDEASLVLTGGSVKTTLGGGQGGAPVIKFDLLDNAVAEVPSGKFFTTAFSLNANTVAYTSMTIAGNAKLTVNGSAGDGGYGFRVASGSGTTGTTLTNNGTIEIGSAGVMDVMSKATFTNNGTLIVNGKLNVVDGATVTASENTVKAVLTAANGYNYDSSYTRTGTIAVNELTVNYSAPQSAFTAQDSKAVDDLARFLGAMHRNTTANAATIKYGDKTYTWDNEGTLKGSNWKNGSTTLVSAIATALGSGLQDGTSTNFTITVDGVNVTVNVTIATGSGTD